MWKRPVKQRLTLQRRIIRRELSGQEEEYEGKGVTDEEEGGRREEDGGRRREERRWRERR